MSKRTLFIIIGVIVAIPLLCLGIGVGAGLIGILGAAVGQ